MAEPARTVRPASDVEVVLASASPRRRELLARLGIAATVIPADIDETARLGESAQALVGRLSMAKATAVTGELGRHQQALVIAADTVVVCDGEVLGKPETEADATEMLRRLSGRGHAVLTSVAACHGALADRVVVRTEVQFRHLEASEVAWYVRTGEPFDKAGGYGLQGGAAAFVVGIEGSDTNVIGLPLEQTVTLCRRVGVDLLA